MNNISQVNTSIFDRAKRQVEDASSKGGWVGQESQLANAWASLAIAEALNNLANTQDYIVQAIENLTQTVKP